MSRVAKSTKHKLHYPDFEELLTTIAKTTTIFRQTTNENQNKRLKTEDTLLTLKDSILHASNEANFEFDIRKDEATFGILSSLSSTLSSQIRGDNEFYAIIDKQTCNYVYLDSGLTEILGVSLPDIHSKGMCETSREFLILHTEDLNHFNRYKKIVQHIFHSNWFDADKFTGQHIIKLRLNTENSTNALLKENGFVVVEKQLYLNFTELQDIKSRFALDKFIVSYDQECDFVSHYFNSTSEQVTQLNAYSYLVNAHLIAIPVKYLLLLDERNVTDGYKAIANNLNILIKRYTQLEANFDEKYVGDCFLRTIRTHIEQAYNKWDKRKGQSYIEINNDIDALRCAKKLGLIPMPIKIKDMILRSISAK